MGRSGMSSLIIDCVCPPWRLVGSLLMRRIGGRRDISGMTAASFGPRCSTEVGGEATGDVVRGAFRGLSGLMLSAIRVALGGIFVGEASVGLGGGVGVVSGSVETAAGSAAVCVPVGLEGEVVGLVGIGGPRRERRAACFGCGVVGIGIATGVTGVPVRVGCSGGSDSGVFGFGVSGFGVASGVGGGCVGRVGNEGICDAGSGCVTGGDAGSGADVALTSDADRAGAGGDGATEVAGGATEDTAGGT